MSRDARSETWWGNFRRTLAYLRPHRRPLAIGLFFALFVSVFYTFSISSVIPLLKVIFADHETLVDWLHRVETERRLDVFIAPDLPDDPSGLVLDRVQTDSRSADVLQNDDRIVAINGEALGSYGLMRFFADYPDKTLGDVLVRDPDGRERVVQLELRAYHWWSRLVRGVAAYLPEGKDADSRLFTLGLVMGAFALVSLLGAISRIINEGMVATAVQRSMHDLRSDLADHVLRLPLNWHSSHPPGDTLGRFATDLNKVEVGMTTLFGKTVAEPLKAAGVIALALAINYKLLLVALLGLPIGAIVMRSFGRMVKRAQKNASQSWGRLLDHLGERLAGIRVVKAYGMEGAESHRFEREGSTLTRAQTHIELIDAATKPVLEVVAVVGVVAFVLYGGSQVFSDELEPHLFFAAVVCLGGIFDPMRKLGNVNNRLQAAEASARRLYELLDRTSEEPEPKTTVPATVPAILPALRERIEFEHVTFSYPGHEDKLVLDDVTLTVERGQVVALVGPNGSGKTTLMSLLLRFYEPTGGRILIDGTDIGTVSLLSLRERISLVTQDAVVFSGTVRDNIAYGSPDANDERVRQAAQLAHIDDFISELRCEHNGTTAAGYDAYITARSLSGGQRQRIALARAMVRNPPILVLDEATSQVDSESERKIQEALEDVTRGRTTFIIAHRFSTIARADVTVVLNEGRLLSYGRHADLLETCPFYVSLCETQFAHGA